MSQANSRFVMAVHALAVLSYAEGVPRKSELIAASINTSPVVLRRLMCQLKNAGLVVAEPGPQGGFQLARPAKSITLKDAFQAVELGELFLHPRNAPNKACPVGCSIWDVLAQPLQQARESLEKTLAQTTIADITVCLQP